MARKAIAFFAMAVVFPLFVFARGGGGCFLPDTKVRLEDGATKPISEVKPGDRVLGFDADNALVGTSVLEIYKIEAPSYYQLKLTTGETLRATAEHPLYAGNGRFITVENLRSGDTVYALRDGLFSARIASIEHVEMPALVYNLRTDEPHTFFAGDIAVHNKGGGGGGGGGFGGGGRGFGGGGYYGHRYYTDRCYDANGNSYPCRQSIMDLIFLFVMGVAIIGGLVGYYGGRDSSGYVFAPSAEYELDLVLPESSWREKSRKTRGLLAAIAPSDARFAWEKLEPVARHAFETLQACWEARDYSKMENLVMPSLADSHRAQIESMISNHEINRIEKLSIKHIEPVHVVQVEGADSCSVTVLIEASAADYYVNDRSGALIRGNTDARKFQEFWVFQWQRDRWLLREIEQIRGSDAISRFNVSLVAGATTPQEVPKTLSKVERQIYNWSLFDPAWKLHLIHSAARNAGIRFFVAEERLSMESLNGLLTDEMYRQVMDEMSRKIRQKQRTEYRNLCVRNVEIVFARKDPKYGDEFTARIKFHAQKMNWSGDALVSSDPDVREFTRDFHFKLSEGKILLAQIA